MMNHVNKRFSVLLALCAGLAAGAAPVRGDQPSAQEILRDVRIAQGGEHRVLDGRLRQGGESIPFRLALDGNVIRYHFTSPEQTLILRMGENGSTLEETSGGETEKISPAQFDTPVRDTDLTYEDLSLRFLYWPNATVEGEEIILTRRCWKLRLLPPSGRDTQYGGVILWVEKESGAFLRADGYDKKGVLAKRFEVRSVQKADGIWLLKQMRIERFENGKPVKKPPTYLEIQGVEGS